jgi:hypothetical protein
MPYPRDTLDELRSPLAPWWRRWFDALEDAEIAAAQRGKRFRIDPVGAGPGTGTGVGTWRAQMPDAGMPTLNLDLLAGEAPDFALTGVRTRRFPVTRRGQMLAMAGLRHAGTSR